MCLGDLQLVGTAAKNEVSSQGLTPRSGWTPGLRGSDREQVPRLGGLEIDLDRNGVRLHDLLLTYPGVYPTSLEHSIARPSLGIQPLEHSLGPTSCEIELTEHSLGPISAEIGLIEHSFSPF